MADAEECKERRPHYEIAVRSLLAQLLIRIHRVEEVSGSHAQPLHPMQDKISEIVAYVNNNYTQPLTLEGAANRFYISPSYLSRMFSRFTGFRFSEYLGIVRVREAQRRLLSTQERVQMIAEKVDSSIRLILTKHSNRYRYNTAALSQGTPVDHQILSYKSRVGSLAPEYTYSLISRSNRLLDRWLHHYG